MAPLMTPEEYAETPPARADHRIGYGPHPDQFGELFLPGSRAGGSLPVVVLLHGGCWRARFGLAPLGQLARRLSEQDCAVWNLEYRRLGGGGGWPDTFRDVAAGTDHLRTLAEEHRLDLERAIAVGHSAGGHLALWLAERPLLAPGALLHAPRPLPLAGVISLAGIPDLALALAQGICGGAPAELMGGTVDEVPERYAQGSPHAGPPLAVRQWHVAGEDDVLVPAAYVSRCVAFARARGEAAELVPVPRAGHFEIVRVGSAAWPLVEDTILGGIP